MSIKQTNRLLLWSVIIALVAAMFVPLIPMSGEWGLGEIIKYMIIFLIGLIMIKKNNEKLSDYLPYNVPMKFRTALVIILIAILASPVMNLLVSLGGLIFGNDYQAIAEMFFAGKKEQGFLEQLFTVAVIPAVFEEMFYRGFFYGGYRKGRGARTAIIMTGILFGTFHMIAQQALYAAFAGIMLAVIRELTGSLWPGMWFHFINNGSGVAVLVLAEKVPGIEAFFPSTYINFENNKIVAVIAAVIALVLIILCLKLIASIEGKTEEFKTFFRYTGEKRTQHLITPALIITLLIQCGIMLGIGPLMNAYQDKMASN